jgi:hypothetical protein
MIQIRKFFPPVIIRATNVPYKHCKNNTFIYLNYMNLPSYGKIYKINVQWYHNHAFDGNCLTAFVHIYCICTIKAFRFDFKDDFSFVSQPRDRYLSSSTSETEQALNLMTWYLWIILKKEFFGKKFIRAHLIF